MSTASQEEPLINIRFSTIQQRGQTFPVIEFMLAGRKFGFGGAKAKHLLHAIKKNGVEQVVEALRALVVLTDPDWVAEHIDETKPNKPTAKIAAGTGHHKPEPKSDEVHLDPKFDDWAS